MNTNGTSRRSGRANGLVLGLVGSAAVAFLLTASFGWSPPPSDPADKAPVAPPAISDDTKADEVPISSAATKDDPTASEDVVALPISSIADWALAEQDPQDPEILAQQIELDRGEALQDPTAEQLARVQEAPVLFEVTGSGSAEVQEGVVEGTRWTLEMLGEPPVLTRELQDIIRQSALFEHSPTPPIPETGNPELVFPDGPATGVSEPGGLERAAGDFVFFENNAVLPAGANYSSVNEPSSGNADQMVFYTGNWFAGVSDDDGQTWSYVNPYTEFSALNGGFCCDQVVTNDRTRDLVIWALQYSRDATSGSLRIAVANGVSDLENQTWCSYTFTPQGLGFPTNRWTDYPDMVVGANNLYVTSNVFDTVCPGGKCPYRGTYIMRLPLDELAACQGFGFSFFNQLSLSSGERRASFRATHGAGTTMYWAAHNTTSEMRIYRWAEGSGTIFWDNVGHTAYSTGGDAGLTCPDVNGRDACGRANTRVLGAAVAGGELVFMWMSAAHGGFAMPYTRVATFNQATRANIGNFAVFNDSAAFIYPSISVNSRGDFGGSIYAAGGTLFPRTFAWLNDDFNPPGFQPLEVHTARTSTIGPSGARWGDYTSSEPHSRYPTTWIATGHTKQGGSSNQFTVPQHMWFGRERDTPPPRPANDACRNATVIPSTSYHPALLNTRGATISGSDPIQSCTSRKNSNTVWYKYTTPSCGTIDISTCGSNYDTVVSVYRGTCNSLFERACNDNNPTCSSFSGFTSEITGMEVLGGETFLIEVSDWNNPAGGDLNFDFDFMPSGIPFNDTCENASFIPVPGSGVGSTTCATSDNVLACGTSLTTPGVWHQVTGTGRRMTATTCNGALRFDTKLSVYCNNCASPTCITGNDDAPGQTRCSTVSWCSEFGATYRILVHGFGNATGTYQLDVSDSGPPCSGAVACGGSPIGACCAAQDLCIDGGTCATGSVPLCDASFNCHCFSAFEGGPSCSTNFFCAGATDCPGGTSDCLVDEVCLVDTCCGTPKCAPASCDPAREALVGREGDLTAAGETSLLIERAAAASCIETSAEKCALQGGTYQGDFTTCENASCPGPLGACCVGGSCIGVMEQEECAANGGLWTQGETCATVNCPQPEGCCLPDGTCTDSLPTTCKIRGGASQGPGSKCTAGLCEPVEACCLPDGRCGNLTPSRCRTLGGTSLGPDTKCLGDINKNGVDDACELEACCLADGTCSELSVEDCLAKKGVPRGPGTRCLGDINPKNGIDDACELGGKCGDPNAGDCFTPNATPFCDDEVCCNRVCEEFPECCEGKWTDFCVKVATKICEPVGACCLSDGACVDLVPADECLLKEGSPQGPGTVCDGTCPATQACCTVDGTACKDLSPLGCTQAGGVSQGVGTDCDLNTDCRLKESCCFGDGTCSDVPREECLNFFGSPGGPGSICNVTTFCEAVEACCIPGGGCKELPPIECEAAGGKPLGPGSDCLGDRNGNKIDDACERQACCLPAGECGEIITAECREKGGVPNGVGTICLGDIDKNGIDDACDADEPCEDCGPGPHWIDKCEPGFDGFPSSAVIGIDLNGDCEPDASFRLSGPALVQRFDPVANASHHFDTEIVSMSLTGGGLSLTAGFGTGLNPNLRRSLGRVVEDDADDRIGHSSFEIFAEIDLGGLLAYNQEALRVEADIFCVPPVTTYTHVGKCIKLWTSPVRGQGEFVANLVTADHSTFPQCGDPAAGDCFNPNATPYCDNGPCCERVCEKAPNCCEGPWTEECAGLAREICVPPQACCLPEGACAQLAPEVCKIRQGTPLGSGSQCAGDNDQSGKDDACEIQACCIPETGECADVDPFVCREKGGVPQGLGSICGVNTTCQVAEACCLPEGICGLLIPDECIRRGGLPQGRASCDGIECLITACCFPDGSCENIPPNFCVVEGGDPGPLGTVCLGDNNNNQRDDFCDCAGDVNGDGAVDAADKGFIQARYGCSVIDPNCAQADANRDGAIDAADTGFVEARYGSCQPIKPPPDR